MVMKLAKFRIFNHRRGRNAAAAAVPSNDNRLIRAFGSHAKRMPRPVLVCRWRTAPPAGALECVWHIESGNPSNAEEPGISRLIGGPQRWRGAGVAAPRPGFVVHIAHCS
jgi:hypothetical protein